MSGSWSIYSCHPSPFTIRPRLRQYQNGSVVPDRISDAGLDGDSVQYVQICGIGCAPHIEHLRWQLVTNSVSLRIYIAGFTSHDKNTRQTHGCGTPPSASSANHRTRSLQYLCDGSQSELPQTIKARSALRWLVGIRSSRLGAHTRSGTKLGENSTTCASINQLNRDREAVRATSSFHWPFFVGTAVRSPSR